MVEVTLVDAAVRLSVCLSHFLLQSRLLGGDMHASVFQTYSVGGNTVGYACIQMLSAGAGDIVHRCVMSCYNTCVYGCIL